MIKSVPPNIIVQADPPQQTKNGIVLVKSIETTVNATAIDVYEDSGIEVGQRLAIPIGFFKPVPGETLIGTLDVEEAMFVVM